MATPGTTASKPPAPAAEPPLTIATPHGSLRFDCPNATCRSRAQRLLTKEPETIEWIERFTGDDILWDIGANVGVYTLYAGHAGKVAQALAFEPGAANFLVLCRNIELNRLGHLAAAYPLAITNRTGPGFLHMHSPDYGRSRSSFDDPIGPHGELFEPVCRQGTFGVTIDDLIERFGLPCPTRLKIDVDGIEDRVVAGAPCTLANPRLLSVSIELDQGRPDYTNPIVAAIERAGFILESVRHGPEFDTGTSATIFNYQFFRENLTR